MLFKEFTDKLENASAEVNFYRLVIAAMLVLLIVLGMSLIKVMGTTKTIITPPEIKRSFWVSDISVSQEYLEEMGYWYAGLALNVTPQGAEYQNKLFLQYADPETSGVLKAEAEARAEFLRKNAASTVFAPRTLTVDMPNTRVAITGTLTTYVADRRAGERNVTYMVRFNNRGGVRYLYGFAETSEQDPFADGTPLQ